MYLCAIHITCMEHIWLCLYVQVYMYAMQEYMSICACLYMCTFGLHRCVGEQHVHVFCMCAGAVLCSCVRWSQVHAHGWCSHASFPVSGNTHRKYSCEGREELWNGDWLFYSGFLCLSLEIGVQHGLPCTAACLPPQAFLLCSCGSADSRRPQSHYL